MKDIVIVILFFSTFAMGQNKFITRTGTINFEASVPSFEEVAATNKSATVIVNTENGELAALVLVKAFRFKNALMEEHFNESYAESDKFPKATFRGKLLDFSFEKLSNETDYLISGKLEFHNVTKCIENIPVRLIYKSNKINLSGTITVQSADFNIIIPSILQKKVSDKIEISFSFVLLKQ
ncbi:YceI family protein [Marixanthomonas sp. SCSIO 43207]|uniref:YceI family protein n=1 Tax=Marixanthomonas sp. SCSIO 43207 TaxID=2779360 RepID=UPI001CA9634C|nr:YceI family protein [Marixanthomonas sp. SCSIO 43207]UAB82389.1 YceI family protein [Marixanthomonas sp. SCSIO 43207]